MATEMEFVNYKEFVAGLSTTENPTSEDKAVISNPTNGPRAVPGAAKNLSTVASELNGSDVVEVSRLNSLSKITRDGIVRSVNGEEISRVQQEDETSEESISFVTEAGEEVARIDGDGLHTKGMDVDGVDVGNSISALDEKTESINDSATSETSEDSVSFVTEAGEEVARIDGNGLHVENLYDLEGNSFSVGKFNAKILYKSVIPNTDDFETTSWTASSGGLTNAGFLGFSNRLRLKKSYSMTHNIYHWEFQPTTNAKVIVGMESREEVNNDGMSLIYIDFATKKVTFARGRSIDSLVVSDIEVPFVASDYENRKFRVCVYREFNWQMRVVLYNLLTSNPIVNVLLPIVKSTSSGSEGVWTSPLGHWHDAPFCYSENAPFTIYDIVVKTRVPADDAVTMCIFGDSITEGYNSDDERLTYGQRLASILPAHKIKTSGRCQGQISGVAQRIACEATALHPKYIMVLIGVNGGNTETNVKDLIQQIIDIGSIPIINHITGSGSSYNPYNILIDNCVNYYKAQGQEIYCVKMDISMALNYDISNGLDQNLMHDHIHPDKFGHERMYLRMRNDCPFLFND